MAFSSGTRHAVAEAAMWLAAAAAMVVSIVYFDEIRGFMGLAMKSAHQATVSAQVQPASAPPPQNASAQISAPGDSVRLTAGPHGHFRTDARINGARIEVMVDTGASVVALTHDDARRAGIVTKPSDFKYTVSTANGPARIAVVNLERVSIGNITVYDVRAAVGQRGAMQTTLLGMSFLSKLRRAEMRRGELFLEN